MFIQNIPREEFGKKTATMHIFTDVKTQDVGWANSSYQILVTNVI